MIKKMLAYSPYQCDGCGQIMLIVPASQGVPNRCEKCGLGRNEEAILPKQDDAVRMKQQGGMNYVYQTM